MSASDYRYQHNPLIIPSTAGVAEPTSDRPVALLIFGEHAREIITTDTGLWLAKVLVGDVADIARWPEMQPVLQGMGITGSAESALKQWASFIVNHMIVKVGKHASTYAAGTLQHACMLVQCPGLAYALSVAIGSAYLC